MALSVAKKVGEGYGKPKAEEELPIDINYAKLVEWLISRKKLVADWRKRLPVIQAQAAALANDLPAELRSDALLDYYRCRQIAGELAKTSERSMFGGLTGAAKEWEKVVRVYEKGNVFLGEAALALVSNSDYEIPFLRKQATSLNSQLVDLERKSEELKNSARAAAANYKKECQALSIKGTNVRSELVALVTSLPSMFDKCVDLCRADAIGKAIKHYKDFTAYSSGAADYDLVTLMEVRDATTAPPEKQVALTAVTDSALPGPLEVQWDLGGDEADGKPPTVSWDLAGVSADVVGEAPALLNWDVDIPAEPSEAGEPPTPSSDVDVDTAAAPGGQNEAPAVQWDIDVSAQDAPGVQWDVDVSAEDSPGVDWGIGLDGDGEAPAGIDWGASTGEAATAGPADEGVTSDDPVTGRLVADVDYRNRLLDNLVELQAFLAARSSEARGTSAAMLLANAPEAVQRVDANECSVMLSAVDSALTALGSDSLRQLVKIKTSPQFTARLVRSMEMKASQEGRLLEALKEVQTKQTDTQRQLVLNAPKLLGAVESTRTLKSNTEAALGVLLKRTINIIGEINTVLNK